MNWTGGYFPDLNSSCLWRRECIEVRNCQLCGRGREAVAPNISVTSYFVESGAQANQVSSFEKVGNTTQHEVVVVIVLCTRGTGIAMVMSYGLEAG